MGNRSITMAYNRITILEKSVTIAMVNCKYDEEAMYNSRKLKDGEFQEILHVND